MTNLLFSIMTVLVTNVSEVAPDVAYSDRVWKGVTTTVDRVTNAVGIVHGRPVSAELGRERLLYSYTVYQSRPIVWDEMSSLSTTNFGPIAGPMLFRTNKDPLKPNL